jgi:chemosensory pili system protein ChpA (sensor histidine kinase/response regulator)
MKSVEQMVQNLASELGKEVQVAVDVACDTVPFLRKLQKPIIHIARNAIDHGIEDPMERLSVGKNPQGMIRIGLKKDNGGYKIIVSDDGAGINFQEIERKAVANGQLPGEKNTSQQELVKLIFSPHFSSKDENTEVSGRGLGLDIVHDAVKELGGKISVATAAKKGTKFTLMIPG